jgi:tetratricopeptide (TPR) repeat protein/transcriptional regulator with XRE-family HTH domain
MSEASPLSFGAFLRRLRTAAGLTQEQLADAAKVSYRSISDLERGVNRSPRRDTARLLADALGLSGQDRAAFEAAAWGQTVSTDFRAVSRSEPGGIAASTRTLPRDIASFTGRKAEIESLLETVTGAVYSGNIVEICAIGGMAGIGKTTLAVHAAHRLAERFPDGQFFLQLHGHTPGHGPVDPADALASLLQAIGIPSQDIPEGLEPRAWLWRDRLADKRMLLVLDDAAGHDQVRPLLPGAPGTLVLITSRHHLTALEDVRVISLDTLPPGDATALLVSLAMRPDLAPDDDAVRELVRLCGYLPLAVGMLARQLYHHPAWSADYLTAELSTARERLELMRAENLSITAAFDLSYRHLTSDEQRLFRYLGLHPGAYFDIYAAAALAETDLATTRSHISALYDHYLLRESTRGRYEMHDLIGEYARSLAATEPTAIREAAVDRLMCYYLHTIRAAGAQFNRRVPAALASITHAQPDVSPEFPGRTDAEAWMRAEQVNLYTVARHAMAYGHLGYAIEIPAAMHWFVRDHVDVRQLLKLHDNALTAARRLRDQQAEADALTNIGDLQQLMGQPQEASSSLSRAIELYSQHGNELGIARALTTLGYVQYLTGDNGKAEDYLADALKLYEALNDHLGIADTLVYMSRVHIGTGNYLAASADIRKALRVYPGTQGVTAGELHPVLSALQKAIPNRRDYSGALRTIIVGLEFQRGADNPNAEVDALRRLAFIQQASGNSKSAMASLNRALQLSREFGIKHGEARSLHYLGLVQHHAREYQEAAASLHMALEVYSELGTRHGEAQVINVLGELAITANQHDQARDYYEKALAIATEIASWPEAARALEGIGQTLLRQGRPGEAGPALRQALDIYNRISSPRVDRVRAVLRGLS